MVVQRSPYYPWQDKTKPQKNNFLWPNWPGQARAPVLTSQWVITGSLPDIWTILCGFVARRSHIGLNYPVSNQSEKLSLVLHPICDGGRWSMELNICSIHFISCQGMIVISVIQVQECGRYYTGDGKTSRKLWDKQLLWDEGMLFCLSRC